MAAIIKLSQNEWVKDFFCANGRNQSWQVGVSLRGKTKVAESKMAKFKMAEFKMTAIIKLIQNEWVKFSLSNMVEFKMAAFIKLSQNEWVKVFFVQMVGTNLGKCEWVWEGKLRWLNPRWPNSRWLPSSSWVRMNDFESDWISLSQSQSGVRVFLSESDRRKQGVWIQHGRIQDGCNHQVESEWMSEGFFVLMVGTNPGKFEWVWEEKLR